MGHHAPNSAQAQYEKSPDLQDLLHKAMVSPTLEREYTRRVHPEAEDGD